MIVATIKAPNGATATLDDEAGWASGATALADLLNTRCRLNDPDRGPPDTLLPLGMAAASDAARLLGAELTWTGPQPGPLPDGVVS